MATTPQFDLPSAISLTPKARRVKQTCDITKSMNSRELRRKLRRLGATIEPNRGKGGHVMVRLRGRFAMVPTGSGDIPTGTYRAILRQLGLRPEELR